MTKHSPLAVGCLLFGMIASGALAQETANPFDSQAGTQPFASQGGLGDHIASRVLNMNGYNITNLNDPFFEGDAVTLGYFNRNSGWNHTATADMDFGGFDMINIGDVTLDGSTVRGGTFEATALTHPKITGGTLSGISMRNAAIEVPRVTGGTFEAPALLGPSIDKATMTGGEMSRPTITDPEVTGGSLSGATLSDITVESATVTGEIVMDGGRISGLPDPEEDGDAMSRAATQALLDARIAEIQETIDALRATTIEAAPEETQDTPDTPDASAPTADPAIVAVMPDIEAIIAGLEGVPGDFSVGNDLSVAGIIDGAHALYRPTPSGEDALGVLDGGDILSALREMDAVVYNLPGGGLAAGIDPETVPAQMGFVVRNAKDGETFDSIDYSQMIGPMIATIKHMDARIRALEAQVDALQ